MVEACKVKEEDLEYAVKKIDYWYKRNIRFLTIITLPYNTPCIFSNIIDVLSKNNCNILYVWGKKMENRELVTALRESNSEVSYSYFQQQKTKTQLTFIHYKDLLSVDTKYDLVIFDDITWFSKLSVIELQNYIDVCSQLGERVILYSIEKIALIGEKFELAAYNYNQPFTEPRIITTRIDLNDDIPYSLYDYLNWFKSNETKVAVYVPQKEKIDKIYNYFENKLKLQNTKTIKIEKDGDIKKCEKVLKNKHMAIFIITNKCEELLEYCYVDNIVVLFSDDSKYNYKKILYICGQIRKVNNNLPEVLLVSNSVSEEMDKAKDMARRFNKNVWEKQLKRL